MEKYNWNKYDYYELLIQSRFWLVTGLCLWRQKGQLVHTKKEYNHGEIYLGNWKQFYKNRLDEKR
jgi:hypothetical protein